MGSHNMNQDRNRGPTMVVIGLLLIMLAVLLSLIPLPEAKGQLPGSVIDDQIGQLQERQEALMEEMQEVQASIAALNVAMWSDEGALERVAILEETMSDHGIHMTDEASATHIHMAWHEGGPVIPPIDPDPPIEPPIEPPVEAEANINLTSPGYWQRPWTFNNLAKHMDLWRSNGTAFLFWEAGHAPPGRYTMSWDGPGSVDIVVAENRQGNTFEIGDQGVMLRRNGVVTNLVIAKADWDGSTFNEVYLDTLRPFGSFRFMDWQLTNNQQQVSWGTRTTPANYRSGRVMPVEYMVELCNTLGKDPWFCMPHLAGDNYIFEFAELVKETLDPDAKVYIEWSNEVWNSKFSVYHWVKEQAGGEDLGHHDFYRVWAEESERTFRIWEQVLGADRVVRVLGAQLANPDVGDRIAQAAGGKFDAISPAMYFGITGSEQRDLDANTTPADLIALMANNIAEENTPDFIAYGELADEHGALLLAYEGGQHLTPHGDGSVSWYQAYIDVQSHPLMEQLYLDNLAAWEAAGGDGEWWYQDVSRPSKHGAWGHLQYQDQPVGDAPKMKAILSNN